MFLSSIVSENERCFFWFFFPLDLFWIIVICWLLINIYYSSHSLTINIFIAVMNVKEKILITILIIKWAHCRWCRWNHIVNEEKYRLLWSQLYSFTDQKIELSDGQICWHKIFLFIQITNSSARCFFNYHLFKKKWKTFIYSSP